jgi:hypothetical protein
MAKSTPLGDMVPLLWRAAEKAGTGNLRNARPLNCARTQCLKMNLICFLKNSNSIGLPRYFPISIGHIFLTTFVCVYQEASPAHLLNTVGQYGNSGLLTRMANVSNQANPVNKC